MMQLQILQVIQESYGRVNIKFVYLTRNSLSSNKENITKELNLQK